MLSKVSIDHILLCLSCVSGLVHRPIEPLYVLINQSPHIKKNLWLQLYFRNITVLFDSFHHELYRQTHIQYIYKASILINYGKHSLTLEKTWFLVVMTEHRNKYLPFFPQCNSAECCIYYFNKLLIMLKNIKIRVRFSAWYFISSKVFYSLKKIHDRK